MRDREGGAIEKRQTGRSTGRQVGLAGGECAEARRRGVFPRLASWSPEPNKAPNLSWAARSEKLWCD